MPCCGAQRSALTAVNAKLSPFEVERAERVKMLQQRMNDMGLNLGTAAQRFQSAVQKEKTEPIVRRGSNKGPKQPRSRQAVDKRRSGRLAGQDAVEYNENILANLELANLASGSEPARRAPQPGRFTSGGVCPEVYTITHVQALGAAEEDWELFVDGFCQSTGKRVYDPVGGITCHQCRQKTLGLRTTCSGCDSLHGQFCGDCLFMRYGENVREANADDAWTCPCCRDLCNCSNHRNRRGWSPTGSMFRSAQSDGYCSVAHCLVLNNLDTPTLDAIKAGSLLVPGGYPEAWAAEHAVPFPPPSAAAAAAAGPPSPLSAADLRSPTAPTTPSPTTLPAASGPAPRARAADASADDAGGQTASLDEMLGARVTAARVAQAVAQEVVLELSAPLVGPALECRAQSRADALAEQRLSGSSAPANSPVKACAPGGRGAPAAVQATAVKRRLEALQEQGMRACGGAEGMRDGAEGMRGVVEGPAPKRARRSAAVAAATKITLASSPARRSAATRRAAQVRTQDAVRMRDAVRSAEEDAMREVAGEEEAGGAEGMEASETADDAAVEIGATVETRALEAVARVCAVAAKKKNAGSEGKGLSGGAAQDAPRRAATRGQAMVTDTMRMRARRSRAC